MSKEATEVSSKSPVLVVPDARSASTRLPYSPSSSPNPNRKPAFIVGIAGASASGKTTLCEQIHKKLPHHRVGIVSQDSFYRCLTPEEIANAANHNFDEPGAFDWPCMRDVLTRLKNRDLAAIPTYDYTTHSRAKESTALWNLDVVLFEGIFSFMADPAYPGGRDLMDLRIFVETDSDTRLARRVFRDTMYRGRTVDSVLQQYERFVKPSFEQFILPQRKKADIIIPWGDYSENMFSNDGSWEDESYPALNMIITYIKSIIGETPVRSVSAIREAPY